MLWAEIRPAALAEETMFRIARVDRQLASGDKRPFGLLKAFTHNIFEYGDEDDFRRQTLLGVAAAARRICGQRGMELVPATTAEIAAEFRTRTDAPVAGVRLELDTRGRGGGKS